MSTCRTAGYGPPSALVGAWLLMLGLLLGCERQPSGPPAAPPQMPPAHVTAVTVNPRTLPVEITEIGRTAASRRVEVRSRIRGFILARHFQEGAAVREGELLFEIDPREFVVALVQAKAQLVRAEANRDLAARDVERLTPLVRQQSMSQKELDDAEARLKSASGEVAFAVAEVQRQELNLSYTKVFSPVNGIVGISHKEVGSLVDDNANSLLTECLQMDPMHVNFSIPERAMLRNRRDVQAGRLVIPADNEWTVSIELQDGSAYDRPGRLVIVGYEVDRSTGTAQFRAEVPNPPLPGNPSGVLLDGQFVRVRLKGATRPDVLAVPMRAVRQGDQGAYVFVLGKDGATAEIRPVITGDWSGSDWIIDQGLQPGDRVLVDGTMTLGPGMPVVIVPDSPETATGKDTSPARVR